MPQTAVVPFYDFMQPGDDYVSEKCRVTDADTLDLFGPSFVVQFEDGMLKFTPGLFLRPWFPVDRAWEWSGV